MTANRLRARWQGWAERFAVLQPREKKLIAAALAAVILFGGWTFWIEPALLQAERLKKALAQQQAEQQELQVRLMELAARSGDPDATNRAALQQQRERLAALEGEIRAFDGVLAAPKQAPALLQTLLARHRGLSLVSLTTLAPRPLIEPPAIGAEEKRKSAPPPGGNLYRHGIEIRLAGGYHELLAYVTELQAGPQRLLWGGMRLEVRQHPVSELTLTLYTVSLDSAWLVV